MYRSVQQTTSGIGQNVLMMSVAHQIGDQYAEKLTKTDVSYVCGRNKYIQYSEKLVLTVPDVGQEGCSGQKVMRSRGIG